MDEFLQTLKFIKLKLPSLKSIAGDFRVWIFVFFLIRLYGITHPPIEYGHSWRQCFTCMVARNFYQEDSDIFYPRINNSGENENIVAGEFPGFNYLIFLAARLFGYDHWYGRLINLLFSSAGVYFFFLLLRKYFGQKMAFASGIILLSSIWFGFSRKIMPDTFSVSLCITALYAGSQYITSKKRRWLLVVFAAASLGGLCKIPATVVLFPAIIYFFQKTIPAREKILPGLTLVLSALPVCLWYFWWSPLLFDRYHNLLYFPFGLAQGASDIARLWQLSLEKFYFSALHSYLGFAMFLAGIFFMIRQRNKTIAAALVATLLPFLFFMAKSGYVFSTHSYYIIPFVPVMAMIAGYGVSRLPWKYSAALVLFLIAGEGIANQHHDFHLNRKEVYKLRLETIADSVCSRNDRIAVTGDMNPQQIYFINRRGWSLPVSRIKDAGYIESIRNKGCRFLFINTHELAAPLPYTLIYSDGDFIVYRL